MLGLSCCTGGYVGRDGRPTSYAGPTAIFSYNDAHLYLRNTRLFDRSDFLWGASIEMLPKRKVYPEAITEVGFQKMLETATLVRLDGEVRKYEALAEGSRKQATWYTECAEKHAAKAAEVRARLHQLLEA